MATGSADGTIYGPDLSLTAEQQSLLRTALSSNNSGRTIQKPSSTDAGANGSGSFAPGRSQIPAQHLTSPMGDSIYQSPIQDSIDPTANSLSLDDSPFIDGADYDDANFDWDNADGQLFGDLPEEQDGMHDKRKNDEGDDDGEGSAKRHEGNGKQSKKPGRKPLGSSEPTTKRKAQNRAAQRAFRERKERHLKDLEAKVDDLEKASEATNHENGRLRATVDRLNTELREYRQRLSMNSTGYSPPAAAPRYNNNNTNDDFQFAFPKFGDLPGSTFMSNGSLAKVGTPRKPPSRTSSGNANAFVRDGSSNSNNGLSPVNNGTSPINPNRTSSQGSTSMSGVQGSPAALQGNGMGDLSGLFSPSILASVSRSNSADYTFPNNPRSGSLGMKSASGDSPSVTNSGSSTNRASSKSITASPSISSVSHGGMDSSCGTTPEPSGDSQEHRKSTEGNLKTINEESITSKDDKRTFCDEWATACGNSTNPVPQSMSQPQGLMGQTYGAAKSPAADINGIDWMAQQNGGQFDPLLFGDYRDSQNDILSNDFFSDAFLNQDFNTPFNMPEDFSPTEPKKDLMQQ
ncbi:MAG: hypothetical protein Q9183_006228, partial [Haloplaca sp. 2 TL-2023]